MARALLRGESAAAWRERSCCVAACHAQASGGASLHRSRSLHCLDVCIRLHVPAARGPTGCLPRLCCRYHQHCHGPGHAQLGELACTSHTRPMFARCTSACPTQETCTTTARARARRKRRARKRWSRIVRHRPSIGSCRCTHSPLSHATHTNALAAPARAVPH